MCHAVMLLGRRVQAPASIALPFGTFERVLAASCNAGVAAAVAKEERAVVRGRMGGPAVLISRLGLRGPCCSICAASTDHQLPCAHWIRDLAQRARSPPPQDAAQGGSEVPAGLSFLRSMIAYKLTPPPGARRYATLCAQPGRQPGWPC